MSRTNIAWLIVAIGVVGNNFAYLFDIVVRDAPCIWLGPKSGTLIVVSLVIIAVGVWLIKRPKAA